MYVQYLQQKKKFSVKFDIKRGGPLRIETLLPNQHEVDEFILTFRFFIQDNEKCSLRNMRNLYEKLPVSQQLKDDFINLTTQLNAFLDSEPKQLKFNISKDALTNRRTMEVFVYGDIAHANPEKEKMFSQWKQDQVVFPLLEFQFNSILETILRAIRYAKHLNEKAIEELS
jgi:hypothetical protein